MGQLSVHHLGGNWLLLPQALPYMRLARPGPYLCMPARMPRAGPCRPMRGCLAAHASQPASKRTGPGCKGALGVCQASCEALGPGAVLWLVPMEVCRWRGVCWQPGVLRGASSLGPGCCCCSRRTCNGKKEEGPSLSSAH